MTSLIHKYVTAASGKEKERRKYQRMRCRNKLRFATPEEAERAREAKSKLHNKQFDIYQCRGDHYHLTTHYDTRRNAKAPEVLTRGENA